MIAFAANGTHFFPGQCSQRGLTLVELMISILLGSIFSLAIAGVYLHSKRHFMMEEAMARLQENGRFSLYLLRRELRHAGFFAGSPGSDQVTATAISRDCVNSVNWALDIGVPLELVNNFDDQSAQGLRTGSGTTISCIADDEVEPGTDIVTMKRTAGNATVKNGAYVVNSAVNGNQWYLRIGDYGEEKSWFYHRSGGLPDADLRLNSRVDFWEYYAQIFYIRRFSQSPDDGIPSLCVERLSGGLALGVMATRCLVEGVEDMQVEFGVDGDWDGVPNLFIESPAILRSSKTVAARIYLLLRSLDRMPGSRVEKTYQLGAKSVTRHDHYLRRVFSTTVQIRNPAETSNGTLEPTL